MSKTRNDPETFGPMARRVAELISIVNAKTKTLHTRSQDDMMEPPSEPVIEETQESNQGESSHNSEEVHASGSSTNE